MWWAKYFTQLLLSHIPFGEVANYWLQVAAGRHDPDAVAARLLNLASVYRRLDSARPIAGSEILEIGTGWDAINALVLYFMGAARVHTFDIARHARAKTVANVIAQARNVAGEFSAIAGVPAAALRERLDALEGGGNLDGLLARARISYHAPADATRSGLPERSVDCVVSYAVLAHLPAPALSDFIAETRRILKPGGVAFHCIGMQDPYCNFRGGAGRVRFLKYPQWIWRLFNLNGFNYNNRLREHQFVQMFRAHGAEAVDARSSPDPIALEELGGLRVAPEFRQYSPEQLAVCFSEIRVRFSGGA